GGAPRGRARSAARRGAARQAGRSTGVVDARVRSDRMPRDLKVAGRLMITVQVVPRYGLDVYKLLRDKVTHQAQTWSWKNKAKTRLVHRNDKSGYVEVDSVDGILIAQIRSSIEKPYFLPEKLVGRLVAWSPTEI